MTSSTKSQAERTVLVGVPASPGFAMGKAFPVVNREISVVEESLPESRIAAEEQLFLKAVNKTVAEINKIKEISENRTGLRDSLIFASHLMILQDPGLVGGIRDMIKKDHKNARWAVHVVLGNYIDKFEKIDSPAMRDKAADLRDLYNRLMGALGAIMGSSGVDRMPAGGFTTDFAALCAGTTVDDALARAERGAFGDKAVRRQVVKTLSELANGLPSGVRPDLHARLSALAARPEANAQPSPERPLDAESPLARLAVLLRKNAWLACPEKVWPADPAASVYPGLTRPGTPSVTRTVPVDLAVPRWHSTGVYAPAGQALTVRIDAAAAKLGLKVRVGSTADDLSGLAEWKRFPLVTVTLPLVKTETTFASPFGGLVYIVVPDGREGSSTVELDGGIMAPWFRLGRDTNAEFARQCAETGAPWGEIEGEDFIVTAETVGLRRVADPQWIASFWDRVLKADQELAGWETRRSRTSTGQSTRRA